MIAVNMEIAVCADGRSVAGAEAETNPPWVCAGRDDQVILQFASVEAIADQIDAGVEIHIAHLPIHGQVATPLFRIVADEVVDLGCAGACAFNFRRRIGSGELHEDGRRHSIVLSPGERLDCERTLIEVQFIAVAAGDETSSRIGLTRIGYEEKWHRAEKLAGSGLVRRGLLRSALRSGLRSVGCCCSGDRVRSTYRAQKTQKTRKPAPARGLRT